MQLGNLYLKNIHIYNKYKCSIDGNIPTILDHIKSNNLDYLYLEELYQLLIPKDISDSGLLSILKYHNLDETILRKYNLIN